jgi:hypothetical protein
MTKLFPLLLAAVAFATPAEAYSERSWQCGNVEVTLNKLAVHEYELTFSGPMVVWSPSKKPTPPFDFKWVGADGAMLNGKMCKPQENGDSP